MAINRDQFIQSGLFLIDPDFEPTGDNLRALVEDARRKGVNVPDLVSFLVITESEDGIETTGDTYILDGFGKPIQGQLLSSPFKRKMKASSKSISYPIQITPIVKTPNDPGHVAFNQLMAKAKQPGIWHTNDQECHKYAQIGGVVVTYYPDEIPETWPSLPEKAIGLLDTRFSAMSNELVADLVDILFWHWLANERPNYAEITLGQILEYRSIAPRPDRIEAHWRAMRDLRAMRLSGPGVESEPIFHISAARPGATAGDEGPKIQAIYRYHPGYFLAEAIQRDAFFLAYHARTVWGLDYYRDINAKRLARVLRAEWRRNVEGYLPDTQKPRYRTWNSLLGEAGIDAINGLAESEPTRFISAIEREVDKLYKATFIRETCPLIYEDQQRRECLPRYGALSTWKQLRVHIAPAADITDALARTAKHRLARRVELKALAEARKSGKNPQKRRVRV